MNIEGRWDRPGVPHKGWACVDVKDLEEAVGTCEMCGQENIRYVHYMEHREHSERLGVGCICAGHMEQDYEAPKERERKLKNRAGRKSRWLTRHWETSQKGNPYLTVDGFHIVVFQYSRGAKQGRCGFRITGPNDAVTWNQETYETVEEAKLASFDVFWDLLQERET